MPLCLFISKFFKKDTNKHQDLEYEKKKQEKKERRKKLEAIPEYWDSEYY